METIRKSSTELARNLVTLKRLSPTLDTVNVEIKYEGSTFTVVKATLHLPKRDLVGEGIARRSHVDPPDAGRAFNIAAKRALESIDKQLRRPTHIVGHRYEG